MGCTSSKGCGPIRLNHRHDSIPASGDGEGKHEPQSKSPVKTTTRTSTRPPSKNNKAKSSTSEKGTGVSVSAKSVPSSPEDESNAHEVENVNQDDQSQKTEESPAKNGSNSSNDSDQSSIDSENQNENQNQRHPTAENAQDEHAPLPQVAPTNDEDTGAQEMETDSVEKGENRNVHQDQGELEKTLLGPLSEWLVPPVNKTNPTQRTPKQTRIPEGEILKIDSHNLGIDVAANWLLPSPAPETCSKRRRRQTNFETASQWSVKSESIFVNPFDSLATYILEQSAKSKSTNDLEGAADKKPPSSPSIFDSPGPISASPPNNVYTFRKSKQSS
mmetsp:Transcript_19630/g.23863  ORF Transcript_19630/g.23863 Transcript_19630/m.23863 type:complete len:331 (+) Transcript_19630:270-1262(+)|eukprot:CAMPEP_0204824658 /NCGR_PEP_ID=MMETSP1346-20131115/2659_1 /ASSEMBLY_ACC=CAM_ASM_000771 /TAXON_ID=215587 /ORGANISM="Aplanochytrium stocchinoi, Strain GSBS06" /LENGTH=330 /DNA_ID=CAMNT_0051951929 /DNA_START=173 /DNA_END=1165 /DNA_ORIENTATION=-